MRLFAVAAVSAIALALAAPASAAVTVKPVAIEADLQKKFEEDYGEREIAVLQRAVATALERELGADAPSVTIEATLVDVKPSRPTLQQAIDKPGLDVGRSVSLGGAELRARVIGADGATIREVSHKWYETDLLFSDANSTWTDARRSIRRFADKVGDAVRGEGS
jgi:hypothetical protein